MTAYTPAKKSTLSLAPHKITGRQVLALNAINVDVRVEDQIARQLAANDARIASERASQKARMKKSRENDRERGDWLLKTWATYRLWQANALGYPAENALAKMIRKSLEQYASRLSDDPLSEIVHMTLTEAQAQACVMCDRLDRIISDPAFPALFRNVLSLIYAEGRKQEVTAAELGLSQAEVSNLLQAAREHVTLQYGHLKDLLRPRDA